MLPVLPTLLLLAATRVPDRSCDHPEFHALDAWIGKRRVVSTSGDSASLFTVSPQRDGALHQAIDSSPDSGTAWKAQLDGRYLRRAPAPRTSAAPPGAALRPGDAAAIRAATMAYRDAWLANDPDRVMATLTSDATLLPSGLAPIHGVVAIRAFWWPAAAPRTTVTAMELTIDEIDGAGDLAYVRGRGTLTFTTDDGSAPRSLSSTFINLVRRQSNGAWLIAERMWSDAR